MATKVWKGHLSLGLLSIPIYLNTAAREKRVELNTYHAGCNGKMRKPNICESCGERVENENIFKAYTSGGKVYPITEEELEKITPESDKIMRITTVVKWAEIDPIFLAESFYMLPDIGGQKAYSLLVRALRETECVAIAQVCKSKREQTAILRPKGNGLALHFCWHADEVASVPEFDGLEAVASTANELGLAKRLLETYEGPFLPAEFEDGYRQRLNVLIASKLDHTVEAPAPVKYVAPSTSQDIMSVLNASLLHAQGKRKILTEEEPKPAKAAKVKKGKKAAA